MMNRIFHHFLFLYFFTYTKANLKNYENEIIDKGRQEYELIIRETRLPKFSSCWTNAVEKLENDCKALTDDRQMEIALAFTNCYLQKSGREPLSCNDQGMDVKSCLENAADVVYTTYTTFFMQTYHMCYFLQHQVWSQMTEDLIFKLTERAKEMEHQMKESGERQLQFFSRQEEAQKEFGHFLEVHKENFRKQSILLLEIFDRIVNLPSLLLGDLYGILYYVLASCIVYVVTSSLRTNGSRLVAFILLGLNLYIEREIVSRGMESSEASYFDNTKIELYSKIWLCRTFFLFTICIIITVCAYRYQDINQLNNRLMQQIIYNQQQVIHNQKLILHRVLVNLITMERIQDHLVRYSGYNSGSGVLSNGETPLQRRRSDTPQILVT